MRAVRRALCAVVHRCCRRPFEPCARAPRYPQPPANIPYPAPTPTITLTPLSGCSSSDDYGSNDCSFAWGDEVTGSVDGELGHDLNEGSTFDVSLKVRASTCSAEGGACD